MTTSTVRERLRQALGESLKTRDAIAASALRSALGALDNASAVPVAPSATITSSPHFAGVVAGLGAGEAPRKILSEDDAAAIVQAEIDERLAAALVYDQAGRADRAGRLRREADVMESALAAET